MIHELKIRPEFFSDTEYCKPGYAILSIAPCTISRAGRTIPVYIRPVYIREDTP